MRKKILLLGAGIQSTALYLMSMDGEIDPIDCAIFADVQEEPSSVYDHIEWMKSLGGPEIITVTAGSLGDAVEAGTDSMGRGTKNGEHYVSLPTYTVDPQTFKKGISRRQCTGDFKIKPVEQYVRQVIFNASPGRPIPKDCHVHQWMGLSYDEPKRVIRVNQRFMAKPSNWTVEFPLFDLEMTRSDCIAYLEERVPHEVPRSACVFCPFKSDEEWKHLRDNDPEGWNRAVEVDSFTRKGTGKNALQFVHKSCQPLSEVDLRSADEKSGQKHLFSGWQDECEGYCGN